MTIVLLKKRERERERERERAAREDEIRKKKKERRMIFLDSLYGQDEELLWNARISWVRERVTIHENILWCLSVCFIMIIKIDQRVTIDFVPNYY